MPIEVATEICVFDQEQFHALDRRVMPIIFQVRNEFGRLLNERLFKVEIANRCAENHVLPVQREVCIRVTHDGFAKCYSMDILISRGFMVEAKTAESIVPAHRNQSLNYLFLTGLHHARLVNLRSDPVQHEFVSTRLTPERRRQFVVIDAEWIEPNPESAWLKEKVVEILQDWGAFLDVALYREAITWLLGGESLVCQPVGIFSGSRTVGTQTVDLLTNDTAFSFTSVVRCPEFMRSHQMRFLQHTALNHLQWVNFNRHQIEFVTLSKAHRRSPCFDDFVLHDFVSPAPCSSEQPDTRQIRPDGGDKIIEDKIRPEQTIVSPCFNDFVLHDFVSPAPCSSE